ncbi:MAG TPA: PHP domain-containing protein [Gemmatimonadaceae bacterium]|nr:PHP domain-containing protein [Gemmatimonadaceae bacterium]
MTAGAPGATARWVDLHAHSTASDGALSPAAMVGAAHRAGLVALALTDHDSVDGLPEAARAARALGIAIVPGVELSAYEGAREVHILGLHLSEIEELERHLTALRSARRSRAERIVERLASLHAPVELDRVLAIAGPGAIGRPHIAQALLEAGHVKDRREAFDRFLGAGRPAFFAKHRLTMAEAVDMIHQAGGLAILAHPGPQGTRERLERFKSQGGDGVEVRHPGHTPEDITRIGALAETLRLLPSGGSDCHGALEGSRCLGGMQVPGEWLDRQVDRVRERATTGRVA